MKKLFVNADACIGCGACVAIDSEHFDFNDEGLSQVISDENIESNAVHNAVASCPTSAISYVEDVESKEKVSEENHEHDCEHCHKDCEHKKSEKSLEEEQEIQKEIEEINDEKAA